LMIQVVDISTRARKFSSRGKYYARAENTMLAREYLLSRKIIFVQTNRHTYEASENMYLVSEDCALNNRLVVNHWHPLTTSTCVYALPSGYRSLP